MKKPLVFKTYHETKPEERTMLTIWAFATTGSAPLKIIDVIGRSIKYGENPAT